MFAAEALGSWPQREFYSGTDVVVVQEMMVGVELSCFEDTTPKRRGEGTGCVVTMAKRRDSGGRIPSLRAASCGEASPREQEYRRACGSALPADTFFVRYFWPALGDNIRETKDQISSLTLLRYTSFEAVKTVKAQVSGYDLHTKADRWGKF